MLLPELCRLDLCKPYEYVMLMYGEVEMEEMKVKE